MKRKDIILVVVAVLLIVSGLIFGTKKEEVLSEEEQRKVWTEMLSSTELVKGINEMSFDYFDAIHNVGDERTVIYIGSSNCGWCQKFSPILEEVANENDLKIVYINVAKLKKSENQELISASENHYKGGTPTTLIVEKGKVIDSLGGYKEKDETIEFFKNNGIIG